VKVSEAVDLANPEGVLIRGALLSPSLVAEASRYVDPSDFSDLGFRQIWSAIVGMITEGISPEEITFVSVAHRCLSDPKRRTELARFLAQIVTDMPRPTSLVDVAKRARKRGTMRLALDRMRAIAVELKTQLDAPDGEATDLNHHLTQLSIDVAARSDRQLERVEYQDLAHEVARYFERLEARDTSGTISTGLPKLDRWLGGGLRLGQLHVVLGGTGSGKTSFASQICDQAVNRGHRAVMFSMEVSPLDVAIRDVERRSGTSRWALLSHDNMEAKQSIMTTLSELAGRPSKVIYGEQLSVEQIRQAVLTERMRGGPVHLVAVDHAQVAAPSVGVRRQQRYLEVKAIAEALRDMAKRLNIAVVLTGQLNPPADAKTTPSMYQVRESKDIINCAEVVFVLWHEMEHKPDGSNYIAQSFIHMEKVRTGTSGKIKIKYRGELFRFEEEMEG